MRRIQKTFLSAAALVALLSTTAASSESLPEMKSAMDITVQPGEDFYAFANGDWVKTAKLPAGKSAYATADMLRERNQQRVIEIVQRAAAPAPTRSLLEQQVGDFYASLMDQAQIDAKGIAPLTEELAQIHAIRDRSALAAYLGHTTRLGDGAGAPGESIFAVWIHQGFSQAERNVPHLQQGGLGLSSRDDYPDQAPEKAELRAKYQMLIAAVLRQMDEPAAENQAARIVALETSIARAHATQADTDDVNKDNNIWQRPDFDAKAPGMDWSAYFRAAGLGAQQEFVVWQPSAATGISNLVAQEPLEVWKAYLAFHLLKHHAPELPTGYRDLFLAFPLASPADAQARALSVTQEKFGEAIGRLYVTRYFPPEAKAAAKAMVENIRAAFRARIAKLTWMAPETRAKAVAKLDALNVGLGYPDSWTDFTGLKITRDDALGNVRRIEEFAYRRMLAKLQQPVDPGEWALAPQGVGAIINFSPNAIQFSAGLLQPPYFDDRGDAAANYGSAGAGIAHEISHSFDELGNTYDAQGRLQSWWTAEDTQRFKAAAEPLAAQFDTYCPHPDLCVHGRQVLGESVADLGGLMVAYDAYHLSLNGGPDVVKDGLTGDQRFFIAFAQRWRKLQTEDALRQQIMSDTHLPGPYRSDTVRNMDAWYRAFNVSPADKLYLKPEARRHVW